MVKPCYILSGDDYDTLVNILTSIQDHVEEVPECVQKDLITNASKIALLVLGKGTDL